MVGRLVEKKEVRRLKKDFRQGDSHQPAAAELVGEAIEISLFEPQSLKDALCLGLQAIASKKGIALLKFPVFPCQPLLFFRVVDG